MYRFRNSNAQSRLEGEAQGNGFPETPQSAIEEENVESAKNAEMEAAFAGMTENTRIEDAIHKLDTIIANLKKFGGDWDQFASIPPLQLLYQFTRTAKLGFEMSSLWVKKLLEFGYFELFVDCYAKAWPPDNHWWMSYPDVVARFPEQADREKSIVWIKLRHLNVHSYIMLNSTDKSAELCAKIHEAGLIESFIAKLKRDDFMPENLQEASPMRLRIAENMFSVIYNVLYHLGERVRPAFQNAGGVQLLQAYASIRTMPKADWWNGIAVMCLAFVVNEDEKELIYTSDVDVVNYINTKLKQRIGKAHPGGMSIVELLNGLNSIATHDNYKRRMADDDVMGTLLEIFRGSKIEQEVAQLVRCFWNISFTPKGKARLQGEAKFLDEIRKLRATVMDEACRKSADGLLWNITGNRPQSAVSASSKAKQAESVKHVMISYNWAHKDIVRQLNIELKSAGYHTWIDVDRMTGSTLEAMADAIEQAAIILVFISESYKNSPACRMEAEYAYQKQKPVVPIRVQPKYRADGWLGIWLGSRLYFDCFSVEQISTAKIVVMRELGSRGHLLAATENFQSATAVVPKTSKRQEAEKWTETEVSSWLEEHGFHCQNGSIHPLKGAELVNLARLAEKSITLFHALLKDELDLGWKERLAFAAAIDKLV